MDICVRWVGVADIIFEPFVGGRDVRRTGRPRGVVVGEVAISRFGSGGGLYLGSKYPGIPRQSDK